MFLFAMLCREEAFATGTVTRTFVVGSIKQWREKEAMPWVDIKEKLGPAGDLDSGTAALLTAENVLDQDFSLEVGHHLGKVVYIFYSCM